MENKKIDAIKMQQMIARGVMDTELDSPATAPPTDEPLPQEPPQRAESHKVSEPKEAPERTKRKTLPKGDYESLFMQMNELKDRKAVYISRELHQEIAHFLGTIKSGELSVGAYIENIINNHLELYKEEMDALYESKFKKPSQRIRK